MEDLSTKTDGKATAMFYPAGQAIYLDNSLMYNKAKLKSNLLHEVQHYVQHYEGHAGGTNPIAAGSRESYRSNPGEREARETESRANMSAEQRRENVPKFSLKEPVEGAKGTRTSGLFEKDNIKSLLKERFEDYEKDEENLEIAAEALSNLEPSDDSLWRDPSRVHNIAKGINEQFINKGYVDFRGRKVESPEDVALMSYTIRHFRPMLELNRSSLRFSRPPALVSV